MECSATKATIIINNYNYGRFLTSAIESALAQTYSNTEIVVVDDGSTDDSREIIAGFGNRIHAVLKSNGGQASAFNAGFLESDGDIVCMLDSDDYFYPTKVELAVKALTERPESHWVFHPVHRVFEDGHRTVVPSISETAYFDHRAHALRGKLPGPLGPVTSGIVMSRALLERILPMAESIRITADNYLIFVGVALAPGTYLEEILAAQRIHGNNSYTLRPERTLIEARVHLLIAHEMRQRFPQLERLSNRIFCKAIADYLRALHRDAICEKTIRHYLEEVSIREVPDLLLRTGYHTVRLLHGRRAL